MSSAQGRLVVVTGGARGLGASICEHAAKAGYRVVVLDLAAADPAGSATRLPGSGHRGVTADVTNEHQVREAFESIGEAPYLVVNNAGIVRFGPLIEQTVDDFRAVINVNLVGTYIVAREAALRMVKEGRGVIINFTSINAVHPGPGSGAYPASKSGVQKLTEHFSLELGPQGIRVNCIAPGFIDGGMSAPIYADPRVRALRGGAVPLKGLGTVADIAHAVLWLASDEARYITGQQLVVDGGVSNSVLLQLPRQVD